MKCKELGDLLFQVVFHAQLAAERKAFDFFDVVHAITEKMQRRHPHVFGEETVESIAEQRQRWEILKIAERKAPSQSLLDSVSVAQPALGRAKKLQLKAAAVGFDWDDVQGVFEKLDEEIDEAKRVLYDKQRLSAEIGDMLFTCVNIARFVDVNPEAALRQANHTFETRFKGMEQDLKKAGKSWSDLNRDELEALWQNQKVNDKS